MTNKLITLIDLLTTIPDGWKISITSSPKKLSIAIKKINKDGKEEAFAVYDEYTNEFLNFTQNSEQHVIDVLKDSIKKVNSYYKKNNIPYTPWIVE